MKVDKFSGIGKYGEIPTSAASSTNLSDLYVSWWPLHMIEMTSLTMNEKWAVGSNKFCNLLWHSFYHSYCIEVHLRTQEKHEVTQTFFKVAYECFLQHNLLPKQYNNSVVHLYPHPYYNMVEFQGGQTSGHLLQISVHFEHDAMLQLRTISHLMDQGCKEHLSYTQIMF